jgi:hypothetical protein
MGEGTLTLSVECFYHPWVHSNVRRGEPLVRVVDGGAGLDDRDDCIQKLDFFSYFRFL